MSSLREVPLNELRNAFSSPPMIDPCEVVLADETKGERTRLGLWSEKTQLWNPSASGEVYRASLLIKPSLFGKNFKSLESIGNELHGFGEPQRWQLGNRYRYTPWNEFLLPTIGVAEPVAFRTDVTGTEVFNFNIDFELRFKLRRQDTPNGEIVWRDPRHAKDVAWLYVDDGLEVLEVRTRYLMQYLRDRQLGLLIAHYQDWNAQIAGNAGKSPKTNPFDEVVCGQVRDKTKALITTAESESSESGATNVFRRLHLWKLVSPPKIDLQDPWREDPPFDLNTFTLPTREGPCAPAIFEADSHLLKRDVPGRGIDYMTQVVFRQEVLQRYQGTSGFKVKDNGSVECGHFWGLYRSTRRWGNAYLTSAIGDFATTVPYEEWEHWRQYAVEPPTNEEMALADQETPIPELVNAVVAEFEKLNTAVSAVRDLDTTVWKGETDSIAAGQCKWVYSDSAGEDEFIVRATLLTALVVDGLREASLRQALEGMAKNLSLKDPMNTKSEPLRGRNLLQRLVLVASVVRALNTSSTITLDIKKAEATGPELQDDGQLELKRLNDEVRGGLAAIAHLYDIRVAGGVAHSPSKQKVAEAAEALGLPRSNWARADYLELLSKVRDAASFAYNRLVALF